MLSELDFLEWRGAAVCAMHDRLTPVSEGMRVEATSILSECKCGRPRERGVRGACCMPLTSSHWWPVAFAIC
jgi:hypothetical protein